MEVRAKEDISICQDLTPPLPPLSFSLFDSSLSSHCSSCFLPLSTTTTTTATTTTTFLRYCSTCLSSTSTTSLHFSSAEYLLLSLLHSNPSLFPHSSTADLRLALRLLHRISSPSPPSSLSPRLFSLLTNRDALLSDERVRVGARVMAMARAIRDEREFDFNGGFELEEAVLCLVLTNAVEIDFNGEKLGIAVYDWRFSWINHSCSPNSCFRFVPSCLDSEVSDSSSSSLRIFPSGDAVDVDDTCELAEGVDNYGPRVIVRSFKGIQRGEEVTITYIDLLQPTALRQSELLLEYKFICNCKRCSAVPQAYVDHALQETFCVDHHNCSNIFNNHDKEKTIERVANMLDTIISEYMEGGDPISCCEKVEELLCKGMFHQHIGLKLSPLHYLSLKAYTILISTYKIRSNLSIDETHLLNFDMCRISAAYSLLLAFATHHLFQFEPALIASSMFWVDAGKSLLNLGNFKGNVELRNVSFVLDVNCPSCNFMNKFKSYMSSTLRRNDDFDDLIRECRKCISLITLKIWSFMIRGCKYLEDVKNPVDFGWVRERRTSENSNVGENGSLIGIVYRDESIDVRSDIFQLGVHCVFFGGYLSGICYDQSHSMNLINNLLRI